MSKLTIPILTFILVIVSASSVKAQIDDYISETRGDTVVISTVTEMQGEANALVNAIENDENPPEGRVYELQRGGLYWQTRGLTTPEDRSIIIAGDDDTPMVQAEDEAGPPIVSGTTADGEAFNEGFFIYQSDLTLKNGIFLPAATDASQGWSFMGSGADGVTVTLQNILSEHTNWVFIQSNDNPDTRVYISDSYFVNMGGVSTRRNGGVYDNVNNNTHTIHVENSTHVMAAGMMYKFRNYPINEAFFNHNTFVNASGQLFTTFGHQSNWAVTNNLFVNSNVQAYGEGLDGGETDQDFLPMGIINVDSLRTFVDSTQSIAFNIDSAWVEENYPDVGVEDFGPDDRKILVDLNGVYWDDRLDQIVQTLNDNNTPCPTADGCVQEDVTWQSQMITMNSRTQDMFDDNETYPYLTEGDWIMEGAPQFTEPNGLMTSMVDSLIEWSINSVPADHSYIMHKWRSEGNPVNDENYTNPDWPVNADLSYANNAYLTGGLSDFPLGDLNWFPDQKETWAAQQETEHETIWNALENGVVITSNEGSGRSEIPNKIRLDQNYPNPFNPSTSIRYELDQPANVEITVYNALGRKIATLVDGSFHATGSYDVQFNASNLSSGMYFYRLKAGDFVQTKKMMLIK